MVRLHDQFLALSQGFSMAHHIPLLDMQTLVSPGDRDVHATNSDSSSPTTPLQTPVKVPPPRLHAVRIQKDPIDTSDNGDSQWEHYEISPTRLWPSRSQQQLLKSRLEPHDEGPHYIPELLTVCPPPLGPRMYKKNVCKDTVDVFRSKKSDNEKGSPEDTGPRLERIIYHENFVNHAASLVPKHSQFLIKSSDKESCTFLTKILPDFTSSDLSRRAHTEKDIEDWVFTVIMLPILRAWLAVEHKQICAIYDDPSWIFCSSPAGGPAIPDGIIFDNRTPERRKKNPLILVEVKTPNSLQKESIKDRGTLDPLIPGPLLRMHGHIMKFCWPQRFGKGASLSSQTKILIQVRSRLSPILYVS